MYQKELIPRDALSILPWPHTQDVITHNTHTGSMQAQGAYGISMAALE